jgi:hypothetical protein
MPDFYKRRGSTGYSPTRDFFSTSRSAGLGAAPVAQPTGVERPYKDVGKFNINLLGASGPSPQVQQPQGVPHPLDATPLGGIPVLGDILKSGTDALTKLPAEALPLIGALNAPRSLLSQHIWDAGADDPKR